MSAANKIGVGGSCHWCTEAISQSLTGIVKVDQGWIKAEAIEAEFSEAVIVEFDPNQISLKTVIEIHLHTHCCTSEHSMRSKYRSAIHTFSEEQASQARSAIKRLQAVFENLIITEVIPFGNFKLNSEKYLDYYYNDPDKPFCKTFIVPKLKLLLNRYSNHTDSKKLKAVEPKD